MGGFPSENRGGLPSPMSTILDAAIAYARMGWYVFPLEPPLPGVDTSGKRPIGALVPNGKDDATCDENRIRSWWASHPDANIGIACEPSGLIVLDVDIGPGKKGAESLALFNDQLTQTACARTGSGGLHAVYARGDAEARQSLGIRDGIDIIGKGYIVAAPSRHYTGGTYQWIGNAPIAPVPPVLRNMERVRAPLTSSPRTMSRVPMPEQSAKIVAASALADVWPAKGRHFAFLALAGALAKQGWDEDSITEFTLMVARLMPGCDAKAIADRPLQARDSVAKVQAGHEVAGWGTLATFVPQDAIERAVERLGFNVHDFDWVKTDVQVNALDALERKAVDIEPPTAPIDLGVLGNITPEQVQEEIRRANEPPIVMASELAAIDYPPVKSYSTGFADFDNLLGGGFSSQQMIVLLGKPGAGKTAFVIGCALHVENTVPVLYVSTELQHNEIVARLCSPILGAPWRDIVRHIAVTANGERVTREMCVKALEGKRIAVIGQDEIYRAGEKAIELIARTALAMKMRFGVAPVVFVDYMQELARGEETKQRAKNTAVAVSFRMISQRLDCSIVAVSSVSRAGYGTQAASMRQLDNPEVYLPLAKESGDIDYAAATIAFVDLSDERDGNGWRIGRIAVCKSRHGETGFCGVRFRGAFGLWEAFAAGVQAMSEEARGEAKAEKRMSELEERVIKKVRELTLYGLDEDGCSRLLSKSNLKTAVGGNANECGLVIDKLIREGKLYEATETYTDKTTKRITPRKVIALPPNGAAPSRASEEPLDVASALAGIVGASRPS